MGRVVLDISVSVDGFVTGPRADLDHGLGVGGDVLHRWMTEPADADRAVLDRANAAVGAVLIGRRTYDFVDGPSGWGEDDCSGPLPPTFVVTSHPPTRIRLRDRFEFVTDGIEAALKAAQVAAGENDVLIMGGAVLGRQFLYTGLLDELRLHIAPVVLGDGTPLFVRTTMAPIRLTQRTAVITPTATHLTYDVEAYR